MNIHEFRNTLICVSYAIKTQRTYNALETHMKRANSQDKFAGGSVNPAVNMLNKFLVSDSR